MTRKEMVARIAAKMPQSQFSDEETLLGVMETVFKAIDEAGFELVVKGDGGERHRAKVR